MIQQWITNVRQVWCNHDWRYHEDPDHDYTGYLERCSKCGVLRQIVQ